MTEIHHISSRVHRLLHLQSPMQNGPDVELLQKQINKELKHYKFEWECIVADGKLGKRTTRAAFVLADLLGLSARHKNTIRKRGKISEDVQRILRDPTKRSRADKVRARLRKPRFHKERQQHSMGPKAAVEWAVHQVGVHEDPAGSNSNPHNISVWEAYFGLGACYWCGVFAGYAVKKIGGAQISTTVTYGPDIIADAQVGRNGVHAVPFDQARPGDILVYWGGEHIGLCRDNPSGDTIPTVEGNTSSSTGSQSNGGEVALKTRARSDVTVVARVDKWS